MPTIGRKLQSAINSVLSETLNLLDMARVQAAVDAIRQANYLFICGVGSSGITAEEMKNKLMRIGYRVNGTSNNHFMYMQASLLQPGMSLSPSATPVPHRRRYTRSSWRRRPGRAPLP